jgi:hypothetical protein
VREEVGVVGHKRLSGVEDVGVLGAAEAVHGVEAREAVDEVDGMREVVRTLGEGSGDVRVNALAKVLVLVWVGQDGWVPLAMFDGEARDKGVGVEALECVNVVLG